jgi:peptidoglycan/LPS O-acetylase OafA/YrhL
MTRRLLVLNGLAILMIPIYHAAAYGLQAMFEWTDRYRAVTVPNYDQLGSFSYYFLMTTRSVEVFAVPAFLFVSAFFVAFLARGNDYKVTWDMVLPRIKVLLAPFVVWTIIRYALLLRVPESLYDVLRPYWFIVFLIQGYLLSPLLVPLAKNHWKSLLIGAGLLQLGAQGLRYFHFLGIDFAGLDLLLRLTPMWFFPFQILNFSIGIVAGVHLLKFKKWVTGARWWLLAIVVGSAILALVEYAVLDDLNGPEWLGPQFTGFFTSIYASTFSLCFLAFENFKLPFSKQFSTLGTKSLGIYLGNIPAIYVAAVLLYEFLPWTLEYQIIYQPALIVAGLGVPLLLMDLMKRISSMRWAYAYVFG